MKKCLWVLFIAIFGCCAMNVFADDQVAVSGGGAVSVPQPMPVFQGDSDHTAMAAPAARIKAQVDFGDYRSETLVDKAWKALAHNDLDSVLAYTNKCISLYAAPASKMQAIKMEANLKSAAPESNKEIFKFWALNDVAASYYIQGEAYRIANLKDKAKEAYTKLIGEYSFGQVWDPQGWFWRPADSAKEKLDILAAGDNYDYDDFTSSLLVQRAWVALAAKDLKAVQAFTSKVVALYEHKAKDMQAGLKNYAFGSNENISSYWALNDVGTALFILGEAYQNAGKTDEAVKTYKRVINEFGYSQCWDPAGWFWKPAEAAQQKLSELG